eukprot:m.156950 g.156950  ORF g.156950 m.156950 type:complete len:169 (-) comp15105_c0_seq16:770-1276(-)
MHLMIPQTDIAEGMAGLSKERIVHRDLACRNCLVNESYDVKIGDFGLTRQLYQKEYYRKGTAAALPIRWMAPESLEDGVFTSQSDVWAFGIVIWELLTFAKLPYSLLSNHEVAESVCEEEYRLECPRNAPEDFFNVTQFCWYTEPEDRSSFENLVRPCYWGVVHSNPF